MCEPFASGEEIVFQSPAASVLPVARMLAPSKTAMAAPASAVPITDGVVSGVVLPAVGEVMTGAAGAIVSTRTSRVVETELTFPDKSVAVVVKSCDPSAIVPVVKDQFPDPLAVVVPSEMPLSKISTVEFGSAIPVSVGVLSDVMSSVSETPVSLVDSKFGNEGTGATESTVTLNAPDVGLMFPAVSVAATVKL